MLTVMISSSVCLFARWLILSQYVTEDLNYRLHFACRQHQSQCHVTLPPRVAPIVRHTAFTCLALGCEEHVKSQVSEKLRDWAETYHVRLSVAVAARHCILSDPKFCAGTISKLLFKRIQGAGLLGEPPVEYCIRSILAAFAALVAVRALDAIENWSAFIVMIAQLAS